MAKIAVKSKRQLPAVRPLASGPDWAMADVVCTAGPGDTPFEEQHARVSVALVYSGTFQYRTATGSRLMSPGALLLGNPGDHFCCMHHHGTGDRCIAFSYGAALWESILSGAGVSALRLPSPRIPPLRDLAPAAVQALACLSNPGRNSAEECATAIAATAARLAAGLPASPAGEPPPSILSRVTRVIRAMENEPDMPRDLRSLAQIARLSPYHFLRVFQSATGTTPHQYGLRIRLRTAALRLRTQTAKILDIALDTGFQDAAQFHRAFRAEFGQSPSDFRRGV